VSQVEKTIENILSLAKQKNIPYADIVLINNTQTAISVRLQKQEHVEHSNVTGLGLRAIDGQKQACVSTNDLSDASLETLVDHAAQMLNFAPEDPYLNITPPEEFATEIPDLELSDPSPLTQKQLEEKALEAEAAALDMPDISNSNGADAQYSRHHIMVANSNGFLHDYTSSETAISASVVASRNDEMQRDYDMSVARHHVDLKDTQSIGREAAKRAQEKLGARQVATCQVPVIFERRLSRNLLGQFASAINGATVAKGTSFLKDKKDQPVFGKDIHITNDPLIKKGLASKPFDAEALPCQTIELVKDGVLQHWLLDRRSAKKLGLTPNGCASRSIAGSPSPSASNLYIHNGNATLESLIGDIDNGLYLTETFGMGINLTTGDYSQGAAGFWIENGKIAYPVHNITIAGHLLEMFQQATPANDLVFEYSVNAPSLRIERMTVAGN
jgi:PmbA protein